MHTDPQFLEAAIIRDNPALAHSNHRIETKKRVTIDGVMHELDILVTFDFAPHHRTLFVFECKNWNSKVDKNEVIILAEKVRVMNAQQGFLVAREFTSSAEVQSQKESSRIALLKVHDLVAGDLGPWDLSPVREVGPKEIQYLVQLVPNKGKFPLIVNPSDMPEKAREEMRKLCQETLKKDVAQAKMEEIVGRQKRHARYRGKFGPTRLNSRLIKAIQIDVHYTFLNEPVPTEVVAQFDVPGFGKHLALNFTHPTKGSLRVELSTSEKIQ